MPFIEFNDQRIKSADSADLARLFSENGTLPGLRVAVDQNNFIRTTVLSDSSLLIHCDEREMVAKLPNTPDGSRINRDDTLEILKHFIDTKELHPDYIWTETDQLPILKNRIGCFGVLMAITLLTTLLYCT